MNKKTTSPKRNKKDIAHSTVKAVLAAIPAVGGAASTLFDQIIRPSIEKRRDAWIEDIGKRLEDLEENKQINFEELQKNEEFIDVLIHASKTALSTRHQEKKEWLRNAVINTSLNQNPEENLSQMFMNWIDIFTIWHMHLLHLMEDPCGHIKNTNIQFNAFAQLIQHCYPKLPRNFYELVCKDLAYYGLINIDEKGLPIIMTGLGKRTTEIGDKFLQYFRDPL